MLEPVQIRSDCMGIIGLEEDDAVGGCGGGWEDDTWRRQPWNCGRRREKDRSINL